MKFVIAVLIAAVLALSGIDAFQAYEREQSGQQARVATCRAVQKVDNTLIGLVRQSEKALPTFAYYKEHPDDLVKALAADERAITALAPPKYC